MIQTRTNYIKNSQLGSREVKNLILKYLYKSGVDLNLKYETIRADKDLDNIKDNDYIICPRFSGTRTWILFFSVDDHYYAVNFPKHSQRKKEDLIIHPIDINVSPLFYRGTIMEGIYFRMDDHRYLVIDEVYMLAGQDETLKPKDDRLNNLSSFIKKNTNVNPYYNIFVSQFFNINKKSLRDLYEKIKSDPKIQEIIFYPKYHGKKIYNYSIIDADLIDNVIKVAQFLLEKTPSPDVFNLLSPTSRCKIDIAFIPDIATSKKCKTWFKDNNCKELLVKCHMDMGKKKWIPMEIIESDMNDIDK